MNQRYRTARITPRRRQQGAALAVSLILLLVLTLLAVSGMNTATLELQMAGNAQYAQNAFQAAETGIEQAIAAGKFNTNAAPVYEGSISDEDESEEDIDDKFKAAAGFNRANGVTAVPTGGYSMAIGTGYSAYHFDVDSTGASARNARATNTQSFYIVGPNGM